MENFKCLVENSQLIKSDARTSSLYRDSFNNIIREVDPEAIYEVIKEDSNGLFYLLPLYTGALFVHRRFTEIYEFLQGIDLSGAACYDDFSNSKLIKYYYLSLKYLGKDTRDLYSLLLSNRERENKYSVAVLRNCIFDSQINQNIYYAVDDPVDVTGEEGARHAFYLGYINLVWGRYEEARGFLAHAGVLARSRVLNTAIRKCMIVCKVLLSDYSISYPFSPALKPYFSLIGVARRGDSEAFEELLSLYKEEFFSMNLYFVIRRCIKNLLLEGLRRISVCYSRITVESIGNILGSRIDYLLRAAVQKGVVKGYISDGIFYGGHSVSTPVDIGEAIREVIDLREAVKSKIHYPAIPALTYERVVELENANE